MYGRLAVNYGKMLIVLLKFLTPPSNWRVITSSTANAKFETLCWEMNRADLWRSFLNGWEFSDLFSGD